MFNLKMWLAGFLLGLAGEPLPLPQKEAGDKTPIAYLYNGYRMPPLPEWDKTAYPYAVITSKTDTDEPSLAYLVLSTSPLCYRTALVLRKLYSTAPGSSIVYLRNTSADGVINKYWERREHYDMASFDADKEVFSMSNNIQPTWANYTFMKYNDGTVYLEASEPVPVYR